MRAEDTVLLLLAAGRSLRFGAADKLARPLWGRPLAEHAVAALAGIPFAARVAVVSETQVDFVAHGYRVVRNADPAAGQGHSLALGMAAARAAAPRAVLVALADMPCITAAHVGRLMDAGAGDGALVASTDGIRPMPPALFGAAHFDALGRIDGDRGARDLIRAARLVAAGPGELADIDTPDDLERLAARRG